MIANTLEATSEEAVDDPVDDPSWNAQTTQVLQILQWDLTVRVKQSV